MAAAAVVAGITAAWRHPRLTQAREPAVARVAVVRAVAPVAVLTAARAAVLAVARAVEPVAVLTVARAVEPVAVL
ncbi:hypothetical protein, partial [Pseudomonas fluorescens]|uniref:hypothetical protein n=1 Tax=Pseudomonas fluorescens TaxID=294 RepID=UPI0015902B28